MCSEGAFTRRPVEIQPGLKLHSESFRLHEHFHPRWRQEYFNAS